MTPLPKLFRVRQRFVAPVVADIPAAVAAEMGRLRGALRPGASVAVGVGSRGISNLAVIIREVCRALRGQGAAPFIVPAMGSHGGGTAAGQREILAGYGVTEEAVGAPVRASMEVVELGRTPSDVRVFLDREAAGADFILPVNRVKPHTDFKGENESGLVKMTAIGLGKLAGAGEYHRAAFNLGHARVFREVTQAVLATGRMLGGVAILENARHETARIAAVPAAGLIEEDHELLEEARRMMPRLPCEEIDLLVIDEMGKDVSGAGMDTNIIGRAPQGYLAGVPAFAGAPRITRILVRDLTPASHGNAVGIGLADFTTARLMAKLNPEAMILNSLTALAPLCAKLPISFARDREAIEAGLRTAGLEDLSSGRLVRIKNTLALEELEMSEAYLGEVRGRDDLAVVGEPREIEFNADGNLDE